MTAGTNGSRDVIVRTNRRSEPEAVIDLGVMYVDEPDDAPRAGSSVSQPGHRV